MKVYVRVIAFLLLIAHMALFFVMALGLDRGIGLGGLSEHSAKITIVLFLFGAFLSLISAIMVMIENKVGHMLAIAIAIVMLFFYSKSYYELQSAQLLVMGLFEVLTIVMLKIELYILKKN